MSNPSRFDRLDEPIRCGVPLQKGFAQNPEQLSLLDSQGARIPCQFQVTDKHADGTPRWILLDFDANLQADETAVYRLIRERPVNIGPAPLNWQLRDGVATIETGAARFRIDTQHFRLFDSVQVQGVELLEADGRPRGILLENDQGDLCPAHAVIGRG